MCGLKSIHSPKISRASGSESQKPPDAAWKTVSPNGTRIDAGEQVMSIPPKEEGQWPRRVEHPSVTIKEKARFLARGVVEESRVSQALSRECVGIEIEEVSYSPFVRCSFLAKIA